MKQENNGKILVAIVAMFVVALSIVGFTYAYFTAAVQGNTADASTKIVAGKIQVTYAQSNELLAQNIVPGWISDGKHYYDPVYSAKAEGNVTKIRAVKTGDEVTCTSGGEEQPITDCDDAVKSPAAANGITDPVKFTVTNAENNAADSIYAIKLHVDTNSFGTAEQKNLLLTVKKGTSVIYSGQLAGQGQDQYISAAQTLTAATTQAQEYTVYLTYKNEDKSQNDGGPGQSVKATVEVVGLTNQSGTYKDADGHNVTPATTSTTDYTTDAAAGMAGA